MSVCWKCGGKGYYFYRKTVRGKFSVVFRQIRRRCNTKKHRGTTRG